MSNLPKLLSEHPALHSNPAQALKESVVDVDNDLRKFLAREATFAGTTCICVLMVRDTLIMANSGDSRAVLGMVDPTTPNRVFAKDLSNDHKPDSPAEATRVRAMGGFVSLGSPERGPSRVWLNKAMNSCGLAMARSLGDHALANVGVIAEPEITTHTLGVHDKYLILGSDGIYEFIESKQACEIVHSVMTKKGGDADKACRLLIERSVIAWKTNEGDYRDDITGIVMKLPCINFSDIPPHPESTPTRRGSKF
jgi:serine/threonine protein phosphatase PrpC